MKKMMIALVAMLTIAATGKAMSYEQARNEALFLTDKMAYELNLTEEQYEAAYEINLDYLMGVTSYDDVFGIYWERRNLDLSYILLDWQWNAFRAATYFYRPLYWRDGFWHFGIYARYPHRDYFYFGRPVFYASYRGGHAWHRIGGHGYYHGHRDHFRPAHQPGRSHFGMLDRWNRGDYRHHHGGNANHNRPHYGGGNRNSSTRTTVNNRHNFDQNNRDHRTHNEGFRGVGRSTESNRNFGTNSTQRMDRNQNHHVERPESNTSRSNGSFSRSTTSRSSGSFNGGGTTRSSGSFGGSHSGGSHSGGSFSSGRSGGGSHSGGSHSGGGNSGGGRSFGGRR